MLPWTSHAAQFPGVAVVVAAEAIETAEPVMPARSRVASWLHAMTGMTAPRRFAGLARAVARAALARLAAALPCAAAAPLCAAVGGARPAQPTDASTTAVRAIHERMRCSPAICGRAALKVDLIMVMYLCRCRPGRDRRLLQTVSGSGWGHGAPGS